MNCVFDKILWFQRNNTSSAQPFCFCCKNSGGRGVGREGIRGVDVAVDINGICFRERCGLNSLLQVLQTFFTCRCVQRLQSRDVDHVGILRLISASADRQ